MPKACPCILKCTAYAFYLYLQAHDHMDIQLEIHRIVCLYF